MRQGPGVLYCSTFLVFFTAVHSWCFCLQYIHLLRSSSLKDTAAEQLCAWLCETGRPGSERHSHYLLEVLLYQVALHVSCGRYRSALTVFGTALRDEGPSAISSHLTAQDLCIAWLAYIHLTECRFLPPSMYDLSNANPGRINSKVSTGLQVAHTHTMYDPSNANPGRINYKVSTGLQVAHTHTHHV